MDFSAAVAAIKSRLNTQWAALHPSIPIGWSNDPNPILSSSSPGPVLRAEVRGGVEEVAAWGGPNQNRYRQTGELIVRVLVPAYSGEEAARDYADEVCVIFRGWRTGASQELIFFGVDNAAGGEADRDGNFFEVDVIASFTNDLIA